MTTLLLAQLVTVAVYGTVLERSDPVLLITASVDATCGASVLVEPTDPIVNPTVAAYEDPDDPDRDCRVDLGPPLTGLPAGTGYWVAVWSERVALETSTRFAIELPITGCVFDGRRSEVGDRATDTVRPPDRRDIEQARSAGGWVMDSLARDRGSYVYGWECVG